jgi:hypothetical protein
MGREPNAFLGLTSRKFLNWSSLLSRRNWIRDNVLIRLN